jgi:cytochrome c553
MKRPWFWSLAAIIVIGVPLGAVLFAWFGVYNVAASRGHWEITDRFLRFGMERSVKTRADDVPSPPPLDDPNLIRLGAGHFHSGCAYCHGAPGIAISPIALHMLPAPPDLKDKVGEWTDRELFWIVKHGLKYAGMPAWPAQQRDDEVWTLVAFLRTLPGLDVVGYRRLALGDFERDPLNGRALAVSGDPAAASQACVRCHGADNHLPRSALVPRLHGQPAEMLAAALQAYADGKRHSGIMEPIAIDLTPAARQALASYYSGLSVPAAPAARETAPALIERGRIIATKGDPGAQIPACNACHGAEGLPIYPRLAGQNGPYIESQLRLWKRGVRSDTETSAIMAPIGKRLSEDQITALAAYYAHLPFDAASVKKAGEP